MQPRSASKQAVVARVCRLQARLSQAKQTVAVAETTAGGWLTLLLSNGTAGIFIGSVASRPPGV